MISSTSNSQIKDLIRLQTKSKERTKTGTFVIEGIRTFKEVPDDRIVKIYASSSFLENVDDVIRYKIESHPYEEVVDHIFKQISDTVTPQGILCIVKKSEANLTDILGGKTYMILENLQDPGNLGTILRTAEGAGVNGVIMNRGTVDIYNPKVVRSTMGTIFRVPFLYVDSLEETCRILKDNGVTLYAAHLQGTMVYSDADYTKASAFFIGNEGNGLTEQTTRLADELIKIPMAGNVESLNAGNAATILMYESFRQRGFQ